MEINLIPISIRDLTEGYVNNDEEGVIGYKGKLNIRPQYQREFVYKPKQQESVIETVRKGFPLNTMYWVKNTKSNATFEFEVMDGQQRTLSICEYVAGVFSLNFQYFHNLQEDERKQILDYELQVYFCEGEPKEKLDWFKIINIAGEKLYDQELNNAIYTGPWLTHAKKHFSKTGCPAYNLAKPYVKGTPIRQDYLETALDWISGGGQENIKTYMADHQHDSTAIELWLYFQAVINWVKNTFTEYRKEMQSVSWGSLYNEFKDEKLDPIELEKTIINFMQDEDITKKPGIYPYLLTKNEKHLNLRAFTDKQKREAYERQKGICTKCNDEFDIEEMEADHIKPWHDGGKSISENCQMLCKQDNRTKSGK